MNQLIEIGCLEDFPLNTHKVIKIRTTSIGIFNLKGQLHALPNICPHQIGPLCEGKTSGTLEMDKKNWMIKWSEEGEIITCPWHGLEFRVKTGECLAFSHVKLRNYKVICEGDRVFIDF